jgi:hypothetical protein
MLCIMLCPTIFRLVSRRSPVFDLVRVYYIRMLRRAVGHFATFYFCKYTHPRLLATAVAIYFTIAGSRLERDGSRYFMYIYL